MKLDDIELQQIFGGTSAALINAILKVFTTIVDYGRKFGSSLRRAISHKPCKL